jgi:hypothetical protein
LATNHSEFCVGADVHLDEIVLCAMDRTSGHQVADRLKVTGNLPGPQAAATTVVEFRPLDLAGE